MRSFSRAASERARAGSSPPPRTASHRRLARALKYGKHIAPPMRIVFGAARGRLEDADLVGHLRAADDGDKRALGVLEDAAQGRNLALEQT